jgi:hypothetical protein
MSEELLDTDKWLALDRCERIGIFYMSMNVKQNHRLAVK